MTDVAAVRRHLDELPMLAALAPLFAIPGTSTAIGDTPMASSDPAKAPVRLELVDLLDTRDRGQLRSHRDARANHPLPHEDWIWRDGRTGRGVVEAPAMDGGLLVVLGTWSRHVDAELWAVGILHAELELEACTANCEQAMERAKRCTVEGPCDDVPRHHWRPATVSSEADFLLSHLDWSSTQPWFRELVGDVAKLNRALRTAVQWKDPEPVRCDSCGWSVQGKDPDPSTGEPTWWDCTGCDKTWTWSQIQKLLDQQQPMPLTECAELLGRPVKTLHDWRGRGLLRPVGRDHRGSLYRYDQVVQVAAQRALHRAGARG